MQLVPVQKLYFNQLNEDLSHQIFKYTFLFLLLLFRLFLFEINHKLCFWSRNHKIAFFLIVCSLNSQFCFYQHISLSQLTSFQTCYFTPFFPFLSVQNSLSYFQLFCCHFNFNFFIVDCFCNCLCFIFRVRVFLILFHNNIYYSHRFFGKSHQNFSVIQDSTMVFG